MGIQGLIPFLEKSSRRCHVSEFKGQTVAIDAYCWLHKGAFSCAELLAMNEPTLMYVNYCMKYVNMLLSHNIKPILVFDGQNLPAKALTEDKRRSNREINRRKGQELMRSGKTAEGRSFLRRSVDITHEMALQVIRECRRRNVDCIVAPYEADAQLAYLSINDIAQVVITEDSDLLLFGCKTVMFKMDINGNGILIERDKLHISMGIRSDLFTLDKFRFMCILSGCDYIESLPGIGLSKACKFVNRTQESDIFLAIQKMPTNLNMRSLDVSDIYRHGVVAADHTFRCQLVFDPLTRKQVPLTEPRVGETEVGEMKDDETAFQLALGNFHPRNLKRLDDFNPDAPLKKPLLRTEEAVRAPHRSIWSSNYTKTNKTKTLPTIFRQMVVGKTVKSDWRPPVSKRMSEEPAEVDEDLNIDLMALYSNKKPRISGLFVNDSATKEKSPLKTSRYFSSSSTPSLSNVSPIKNSSIFESSSSLETNNIEPGRGIIHPSDDELSSPEKVNIAPENEENQDENCADSGIDSLPSSSSNLSNCDSQNEASINLPLRLSTFKNNPFQSKENQIWASESVGLLDTVCTKESVFFSGQSIKSPPLAISITTAPKKLRAGLSRPKPSAQQSLLSKFGFQSRPKI